jgi:hypothetical protein
VLYSGQMERLRRTSPRKLAARVLLAAASMFVLPAQAGAVGSVSTVSPRSLAMGGAFLAVEDEVSAAAWNPAGLMPPQCGHGTNVRFHLNVLGAPAIARETGLLTGVESDEFARLSAAEKVAIAVGSVLKAATIRRGSFAVGVMLLEEQLDPRKLEESRGLADAGDLLDAYYSSVSAAFRLAPRVSIGLSASLFAGRDASGDREVGFGRVYGALLRPNDAVRVGLTYFDVPADFAGYRLALEGFAPRTMNAGISYRPIPALLATFDLRDLAEIHEGTALSPRAGLEWNLAGRAALRCGALREEAGAPPVVAFGLGAIPMIDCLEGAEGADAVRGDAFVMNYAALLREGRSPRYLLSVVLHF